MKNALLLASSLIAVPAISAEQPTTPEAVTAAYAASVQNDETYTYVRCWYRPAQTHDDPATSWEWALNENGDYLKVNGYWWSSVSFKNMFYTNTPQSEIKQRCQETLNVNHDTADMLYYASDNRFSYNHSIWTNDTTLNSKINRLVAFGDSLSDTGNLFNGSQWVFPNANSWFLGHFSNGFVWTEYLAEAKDVPLYNWSVGGAAGTNQYVALTGIYDQVTSYLTYMKMAKNYDPKNTLFTLEFGLNDFMNYDREVSDVKADLSSALIRLRDAGAQHLILLTLPDATKAPQFKYSTQQEIEKVRAKIVEFNAFIKEQADLYKNKGMNVVLYDANTLFNAMTSKPKEHGFANAKDACLNINRSSALDYLYSHSFTNDCAHHGSDKYVFWGVTHPTTAAHKYIADNIIKEELNKFPF
ncbi:SGNH/GDSL hydrolase family protein [Vibrio europaeus]|uniref:SGNH/GDSL hydrolase family protein n=1 Tax=Vibrio europaeus TaxID=300876 RepID=A0A178J8E9_9VIBR|nr:SGNH/GDSL hydrolase family protein [Vibrio europaeus]MDC5704792.1 SGNH/GDSL hydrolase family protein [Vibrio europaeus]MDC5710071.1 SGNH/GDSL hydrolase family protein [Vibrio europaeus]MDC5715161.1 SGNH/GDSL hydrolase family protein [Vibrio europaeus]MDC5718985.1 SGNH/GDSL hydrolase family protein [Vibrio europaeus]MDC5724790.1 SGNH/GDSL hydrolase family protein [Vibrio europaeus]